MASKIGKRYPGPEPLPPTAWRRCLKVVAGAVLIWMAAVLSLVLVGLIFTGGK